MILTTSSYRKFYKKKLAKSKFYNITFNTGGVFCVLWVLLVIFGCDHNPVEKIHISEPLVYESIPGQDMTVGYVSLRSLFKTPIFLTKINIDGDVAADAHLHGYYTNEKGLKGMYKVERLELQPGELIKLSPGGYHIMISGLKQALKAGEKVQFVFDFSDGSINKVVADVVPRP